MDPNLLNIAEHNNFAIRRGQIKKACEQAEDYLTHILGFDQDTIEQELNEFAAHVKEMRKKNRGNNKTRPRISA